MPDKNLIEAIDLCKYYKTPKGALHAVEGVNFTIKEGTTLGVVGRVRLRQVHSGTHRHEPPRLHQRHHSL